MKPKQIDLNYKMNNEMAHLNIRKMEITDLEEVQEVEVLSFTNPWPKEILHQELVDNQYAHYFVIELAGQIIGRSEERRVGKSEDRGGGWICQTKERR